MTPSDAAHHLNIPLAALHRYLASGRLRPVGLCGGEYLIDRGDVWRLKRELDEKVGPDLAALARAGQEVGI